MIWISRWNQAESRAFSGSMKLLCFFKGHWPVAAYAPWRDGFQLSRCVDCGHPMMKAEGSAWRAIPQRVVKRAGRANRAR